MAGNLFFVFFKHSQIHLQHFPQSLCTHSLHNRKLLPLCAGGFSVPVLFYVYIGAVGAQESLASSFSLSFLPKRCKYNTEENT